MNLFKWNSLCILYKYHLWTKKYNNHHYPQLIIPSINAQKDKWVFNNTGEKKRLGKELILKMGLFNKVAAMLEYTLSSLSGKNTMEKWRNKNLPSNIISLYYFLIQPLWYNVWKKLEKNERKEERKEIRNK